ncbi:hypothetical protein DPX16_23447 [Anabarilius grahami]|uniref:Uncharacterized protein n=1 Tax=Anabarilius grahami TaxID=495550 RepID=A0A3N0YRG3_ANAGA|nr:hypothetical protein DPX16_23447 [Anabarilius grahami]
MHATAVLQAYQADLLKDLSAGTTIDEEAFTELRRATDLSLRVTKQTAREGAVSHPAPTRSFKKGGPKAECGESSSPS